MEVPQSQNTDQPITPRKRDTRTKTNKYMNIIARARFQIKQAISSDCLNRNDTRPATTHTTQQKQGQNTKEPHTMGATHN